MTTVAEGPLATVNTWLNQNVVPAGVVTGAILAICGAIWATFLNRRRLTWSVVYDAPINIDNQDLWTISSAQTSRVIDKPQLVILEVHNAGMLEVREDDWDSQLKFVFTGMEVMDLKVRNDDSTRRHRGNSTDGVRDRVERQRAADHQARAADGTAVATLIPGAGSTIQMPRFNLNRGAGFRLLVLLNGDRLPQVAVPITSSGDLIGGRVRHARTGRRRRVLWQTGIGAVALTTGLAVGITIANKALTPAPHCASGQLQLEGSTAFAPVATIAKNAYEQQCPNAHIAVAPVGSGNGLAQFGNTLGPARELAMVDGPPDSTPSGLTAKPVGVVIFAVVANHDVAGTLTPQKVRDLFTGHAPIGNYKLVGRPAGSGTRTAFLDTVVQSRASVVSTGACPAAGSTDSKPDSCTAATTMQLLAYVNATPGAVGYAEADALPFFPSVDVVPLDGRLPTRDQALHHAYPFVATENLYRSADRSDLTNDFIGFLTSDAMSARLHDDGFIPCSEIGGTDVSGMCT